MLFTLKLFTRVKQPPDETENIFVAVKKIRLQFTYKLSKLLYSDLLQTKVI